MARQLNLATEDEVIELQRFRYAQDEPFILETSYIPKKLIPSISREELEKSSLYDLMEKKYNIIVTKARESFEPVLIRDYESKYLQVKEGYPALLLDHIAYDSHGRVVEFCKAIVRGDRCRFYTELL